MCSLPSLPRVFISLSRRLGPLRRSQGVLLYAAITIAAAILMILLVVFLLSVRYCCICCCKPDSCTCMRCGTHQPTPKQTCCGCGFRPLNRADGKTVLDYPCCDRVGARIFMVLFIAAVAALITVSDFLGTQQMSIAPATTVNTITGSIMRTAIPVAAPIGTFVVATGTTVMLPLMQALNTVRSAGPPSLVCGASECGAALHCAAAQPAHPSPFLSCAAAASAPERCISLCSRELSRVRGAASRRFSLPPGPTALRPRRCRS